MSQEYVSLKALQNAGRTKTGILPEPNCLRLLNSSFSMMAIEGEILYDLMALSVIPDVYRTPTPTPNTFGIGKVLIVFYVFIAVFLNRH